MSYPLYPKRGTVDLGGFWDFLFLPHQIMTIKDFDSPADLSYYEKHVVPGCFDATGPYAGKRGIGVYRRMIDVPADGIVRLAIGATTITGKIFWDGAFIALNKLAYSGVSYEIATTAGCHELVIAVENFFDIEFNPLFHPWYDFHAFGGILRSVTVEMLPAVHFGRCTVTTLDIADGRVRLDVELNVADGTEQPVCIAFDRGEAVTETLCFNNGTGSIEMKVPNHKVWSTASPDLHTVTLSLPDGSDALVERFGIRTIRAEKGKMLLNGEEIYLAGYNRHESDPRSGAELSRAVILEDLQILRSMHCNFVRGCHYSQSQEFLDLCDEMGILVWEESLGWGNGPETLTREDFCALQEEQTALMVRNSRNHPCVILWGFLNETHSHKPESRSLIEKLVKTIKDFDTSRPVTFASCCITYGEMCLDLVDVISCNTYPGWYGTAFCEEDPTIFIKPRLEKVLEDINTPELIDKPVILSEIGAAALYGFRDNIRRTSWTEEFHSDYITEVCRSLAELPRIRGLALWHFADARSYTIGGTLNRARGFNNKGSLDEYRREKLAAQTVRELFAAPPFCTKNTEK